MRKAAVLVASVDAETARALMAQLLPEQLQQLQFALSRLGDIEADEREAVLREFAAKRAGSRAARHAEPAEPLNPSPTSQDSAVELQLSVGDHTSARNASTSQATVSIPAARNAEQAPPTSRSLEVTPPPANDLASAAMNGASHASGPESTVGRGGDSRMPADATKRGFALLEDVDDERLVAVLTNEHPQTVAVILSNLPPRRAALLLSRFAAAEQAEVVRRMMHMDEAHPEAIREVEAGLLRNLIGQAAPGAVRGASAVREMLAAGGYRLRRQIVQNVRRCDEQLGELLAPPEPTLDFSDLFRLSKDQLRETLAEVDHELMAVALLDVAPERVERVLADLDASQARLVRQVMRAPGPIRLEDIRLAQEVVGRLLRRAVERGILQIDHEALGFTAVT